jgi:hypothetical protein
MLAFHFPYDVLLPRHSAYRNSMLQFICCFSSASYKPMFLLWLGTLHRAFSLARSHSLSLALSLKRKRTVRVSNWQQMHCLFGAFSSLPRGNLKSFLKRAHSHVFICVIQRTSRPSREEMETHFLYAVLLSKCVFVFPLVWA